MSATDDRDDAGFGGRGRDDRHPPHEDPTVGGTPGGDPDPSASAAPSAGTDEWAAKLRSLHPDRLAGRDDVLFAVLDLLYFPTVRRVSARPRFRRVDPQTVADAVSDALTEYVRKPHGYDPSTGVPLDRHLARAAERDVLNLLRSDTRRRRRERRAAESAAAAANRSAKSVELPSAAGNACPDDADARTAADLRRLYALLPDPADRRVLDLQLAGGRRTAAFAAAMDVAHLPPAEQRAAVKRAKDRIAKTLRRALRP